MEAIGLKMVKNKVVIDLNVYGVLVEKYFVRNVDITPTVTVLDRNIHKK
jgi:hypothetical protein